MYKNESIMVQIEVTQCSCRMYTYLLVLIDISTMNLIDWFAIRQIYQISLLIIIKANYNYAMMFRFILLSLMQSMAMLENSFQEMRTII
jgi:hypothetical protein